jgi:hypothetical protein
VEVGAVVGVGGFGVAVGAVVVFGCDVTVGKATVVVTGAEVVVTGAEVAGAVVAATVEVTTAVVTGAAVAVAVGFESVWTGVLGTFEVMSVSLQAASKLNIVTREIIARLSLKKLFFIF